MSSTSDKTSYPGTPAWSPDNAVYQATLVQSDGRNLLEWIDPQNGASRQESASLLAARVLHHLGLRSGPVRRAGVNGMHYWTTDGTASLRDITATLPSASH